jgi:TRAP-type C4-dicarboxylate transport system substrate-binding protein
MLTRTLTALAFVVGCAHVGWAAEASLAHWVPGTHPLQKLGMEPWAQSLKDATGGEVEIKFYPASQLGAAPDHYDMARDGIADISFINPGYQPGRFPILAAAELPFHFANSKGGVRALTEWYQQYAPKEMKDVYFCMAISHDPGTFHSKTPILVPADVKGKTVRPANATEGRFVQMLGGSSVQVPVGEMREALSKGVADMTQSPWGSLYVFGVDSLVKHHLDTPVYASINAFVINKAFLAKLSEKARKAVHDHCTPEAAERMSSGWADVEANGRNKILADKTHTMHMPTPEQLKLWQTAAAPLTDEWKANIKKKGLGDPESIYQGMVDALKKYKSLYEKK